MKYANYRSRSTTRSNAFVALFLAVTLLAIVPLNVAAFVGVENRTETPRPAAKTDAAVAAKGEAAAEAKPVTLLYTPLNSTITFTSSDALAPSLSRAEMESPEAVKVDFSKSVATASPQIWSSLPMPKAPSREPLRFIPMTVGEKFKYFLRPTLLSPGANVWALVTGIRGEAFDKDHDPNGDHGHFLADAGTRAARSIAFSTTAKFFHRFAYASIFRQDPRYHPSYKKGAGARAMYAASRVLICPGDKGGSQFNISFLGAGMTAAFASRLWEREERKSTGKIFSKFGTHVGFTALSNIVREFLSGQ